MRPIYDLSRSEFTALLQEWTEPPYRADQIWQGLYRCFYNSPGQFTALPLPFRSRLSEYFDFNPLNPLASLSSKDHQTIKTLFSLPDGLVIEAVLMKYGSARPTSATRHTLCISSQVGCAMGCSFCATGQMGFKRHLSSGELVAQVLYYTRILAAENQAVTNVVVMGMGEPFHNYENTLAAINRLNDPNGFNSGARRYTISTVGLVPVIQRFTSEKCQVNLAISLHAANDELRSKLLPINNKYPIDELLAAGRDYVAVTGRRLSFEWALIREVNDTPEQARLLARRLHGLLCHVNLILLNPTQGYAGMASTPQRAKVFMDHMKRAGIPCTIRLRRGVEIQAGCGQLSGNYIKKQQ